ncbi:reverse transcriptase [Fusarium beomiforme]|uniref:Reverse transcriptase n=1 Tax=Fusarium beomiforme TaxID=44412 RepID=A0A9P5DWH7_9HYPO|nr:reverse transcriptase [Fusarium beomiforme]
MRAQSTRGLSGAFKATSAPALDVEIHLLSIEPQIWKHNADLDGQGEWKAKISPCKARQKAKRDQQGFNMKELEAIIPHIVRPWWISPKTIIEESVEKAQARHRYSVDSEPTATCMCTDGSRINGHIGATAVCTTTEQVKSTYMGNDTVSAVYAG